MSCARRRCRGSRPARRRSPCSMTTQCTGRTNCAVAVAPAHAPRDRQRSSAGLHDARQQLAAGSPGARRPAEQELALVVVRCASASRPRRRRSRRRRSRRGSACRRRRRRPRPAARAARRAAPAAGRGACCTPTARRRGVYQACGGAVRQARGLRPGDDAVAEGLAEGGEALRRHFLRADLDQEVVAVHFGGFVMRTVSEGRTSSGPRASEIPAPRGWRSRRRRRRGRARARAGCSAAAR